MTGTIDVLDAGRLLRFSVQDMLRSSGPGSPGGVAQAGGWQLIGRTEVDVFDPVRQPPALLRPGNRVRFVDVES
ncbi:MAG: carboxyltransferase domain-containing protein [Mycobacteriales bacterium]